MRVRVVAAHLAVGKFARQICTSLPRFRTTSDKATNKTFIVESATVGINTCTFIIDISTFDANTSTVGINLPTFIVETSTFDANTSTFAAKIRTIYSNYSTFQLQIWVFTLYPPRGKQHHNPYKG